MIKPIITVETANAIAEILKKGYSAEVKCERDNIVVVELRRQVIIKSPTSIQGNESQ